MGGLETDVNSLFLSFRLKLGKAFGSRENVNRDSAGQWGDSEETGEDYKTTPTAAAAATSPPASSAMGAMNGNPSMRSSTGAGEEELTKKKKRKRKSFPRIILKSIDRNGLRGFCFLK